LIGLSRKRALRGYSWSAVRAALRCHRACNSDTPDFPAAYKSEALPGRDFLNVLRGEQELEWTFLSPSDLFVPGERTGKFQLGTDQLLVSAEGKSEISFEDFAIALVDELETPRHSRQRFTVGY
jgi:putative NADH-flavin reductase